MKYKIILHIKNSIYYWKLKIIISNFNYFFLFRKMKFKSNNYKRNKQKIKMILNISFQKVFAFLDRYAFPDDIRNESFELI